VKRTREHPPQVQPLRKIAVLTVIQLTTFKNLIKQVSLKINLIKKNNCYGEKYHLNNLIQKTLIKSKVGEHA
jgi:hypothetical protein